MLLYVLPILYAIFVWWFTTRMILEAYKRSMAFMKMSFAGGTVVLVIAFIGLVATRTHTSLLAVYLAVTCGIVIWGWQMASYYLGFVTGPSQQVSIDENHSLARRFRVAVHFSLYHEVVVLMVAIWILALTWNSPNQWGLWIYLALYLMHASAKLNVFLGVRNFRIELLPSKMHYLSRLISKQTSNALFPFSVIVGSGAVLFLLYQGIQPTAAPAQTAGSFLVATMITLGLVEHWLLVLPLPPAIWSWGIHHMSLEQMQEEVVVSQQR